jgi:hypothetical protein
MNVGEPVDVSAEKTGAENENKYIYCCIGPSTVFSSSTIINHFHFYVLVNNFIV